MGRSRPYEWAVRYPTWSTHFARSPATAKNSDHDIPVHRHAWADAITSDPGFNGGFYRCPSDVREGLLRHAKLFAVMGWSTEFYQQGRPRALGFSSIDDFIMNFMNGYFSVMDPNNLLCMARKWQHGDVSRMTGGNLKEALGRITAQAFVMPINEDMFFPPQDCEAEQKMIPNSQFRPAQYRRTPGTVWGPIQNF